MCIQDCREEPSSLPHPLGLLAHSSTWQSGPLDLNDTGPDTLWAASAESGPRELFSQRPKESVPAFLHGGPFLQGENSFQFAWRAWEGDRNASISALALIRE